MNKKQSLRKTADELWRYAVVKMWGQNSVISGLPADDPHHFFPKGNFGFLRYNLDNGCPLTRGEHFEHHFKANPIIHQKIVEKRGKRWYNKLEKIAKAEHRNFQTIAWYEDNIKRLQEFIEKRS